MVASRINADVSKCITFGTAHCDRSVAFLKYAARADQMHVTRRLPNRIDLMTGFGRWSSQYISLVSSSAPIETAQVGALPQSATNGTIGRKYQGRFGDSRSKTTSNSIFVSARFDANVLSERHAVESIIKSTIDAATTA